MGAPGAPLLKNIDFCYSASSCRSNKISARNFRNESFRGVRIRSWRCFSAHRSYGTPVTARRRAEERHSVSGMRGFGPAEEKLYSLGDRGVKQGATLQFRQLVRRHNTLRRKIDRSKLTFSSPESEMPSFHDNAPKMGLPVDEMAIVSSKSSTTGNEDAIFYDGPSKFEKKMRKTTDSVLWERLDSWANQLKEETQFWGIGNGPIFTIYQDPDGKVKEVVVNEEEIIKRSLVPMMTEESEDLDRKLLHATAMAREIKSGHRIMPKNSTIAKFITDGPRLSFVDSVQLAFTKSRLVLKAAPWIGSTLFFVYFIVWVTMKLVDSGSKDMELSKIEMEMLRRKKISRMGKEDSVKGNVQVVEDSRENVISSLQPPKLDRAELLGKIKQASAHTKKFALEDNSSSLASFDPSNPEIQEIREMVRKVHEQEEAELGQKDESTKPQDSLRPKNGINQSVSKLLSRVSSHDQMPSDKVLVLDNSLDNIGSKNSEISSSKINTFHQETAVKIANSGSENDNIAIPGAARKDEHNISNNLLLQNRYPVVDAQKSEAQHAISIESSIKRKTRIIKSVEEARKYLVKKREEESNKKIPCGGKGRTSKPERASSVTKYREKTLKSAQGDSSKSLASKKDDIVGYTNLETITESNAVALSEDRNSLHLTNAATHQHIKEDFNTDGALDEKALNSNNGKVSSATSESTSQSRKLNSEVRYTGNAPNVMVAQNTSSSSITDKGLSDGQKNASFGASPSVVVSDNALLHHESQCKSSKPYKSAGNVKNFASDTRLGLEVAEEKIPTVNLELPDEHGQPKPDSRSIYDAIISNETGVVEVPAKQNQNNSPSWIEKNFEEFNPLFEKIGNGFRHNYKIAKEKAHELSLNDDISNLTKGIHELEWMEDENLKEIVFKVRENELAGRDPFHMMEVKDKEAFFYGLKHQAEKVNEKLLPLHEYIHSRVENLDYGADGISIYDPPEKIIPRWKGPPLDTVPAYFNNSFKKSTNTADTEKNKSFDLQTADFSSVSSTSSGSYKVGYMKQSPEVSSKKAKTLIECSDGTTRVGRKGGKEHWQHTKKWSQDFLEVYNAENDPEIKSIMKNMGSDLDRWLTEQDKKDVADLMARIPKRKRRYIEKKMDKIKKEVERFGAPAVISKYREYTDENEEDYLWWLDLPFVLCIEMYRVEEGVPKVGFYSLEMAEDLELDPKQYHVIAFEDPCDAKNFCYILQSHMDMLGDGKAFVVPRPPKDAFREARDGGFNVTVIRKGQVTLNVDQTLEEVDDMIVEIGSKMYHDKIMRKRSVNAGTLMKGLVLAERHNKR